MARKLLINAQKPEELRIAILDGDRLEAYQVEVGEGGAKRGNVYRGVITNVQPSLNAAFVDFGDPKNGFLSAGDLVEDAWTRKPKKSGGRPRIEDVLEKGKPILVQVQKDMEGKKGSGLTTDISIAGRYLVFTPFDDKIGISRKVEDDDVRKKLREIASGLDVPAGGGLIIRTNALEQTKATISKDFKALVRLWKKIRADFKKSRTPEMLHDDQQIVVRTLRDFVDAGITEILVDTDEAFEIAQDYMRVSMPRTKTNLVRYADREPLFSRFKIEPQIDAIYDRRVSLRSGGSIVVDRTEALTAVDVNSGRSTKAGSQEETAYNTNLEAAREIARQLRLRDIGGLIVVDFIDMKSRKHNAAVEKELKEAMKIDRARHTIGRISENGLVEINRQRVRKELTLQTHRPCPTCDGTGRIASVEMVGLNLLRRIESRAATSNLDSVRIELHPELADAVQNGRRQQITDLEREFGITVEIIASNRLHRPDQVIDWVMATDVAAEEPRQARTDPSGPAAISAAGSSVEPVEGSKRKRRRKKKKSNGAPAVQDEPNLDSEPEEHDDDVQLAEEPVAAETIEASPDAPESTTKRSRRRRRKRKSADAAAGEPPRLEDHEHDAAAGPAPEPESAWLFNEPGVEPDEGEARPARTKRRRRRKPAATANTAPDAAATESEPVSLAEVSEPPTTDGDAAALPVPAKKRRPRRRSRRKPAGDSGTSDAGVSSPSDES